LRVRGAIKRSKILIIIKLQMKDISGIFLNFNYSYFVHPFYQKFVKKQKPNAENLSKIEESYLYIDKASYQITSKLKLVA
jgi:hypothetical protein